MKKIIFVGIILVSLFAFSSVGQAAVTTAGTSETFANQGILPKSGKTAVLGLNMTASALEKLTAVTVTFTNIQGFAPATDLAALTQTTASGVAIYRDDGSIDGTFASGDGFITPSVLPVWADNSVTITFAVEAIPADNTTSGNVGPDFFVVIRTSDNISGQYYEGGDYRDKFTVQFPSASIVADGVGRTPDPNPVTDTVTCESRVVDLTPYRSDTNSSTHASNTYYPSDYKWFIPEELEEPDVDSSTNAPKSQLLPIYTYTPVLGIDCAAPLGCQTAIGSNTEYLSNVTVTFTDTPSLYTGIHDGGDDQAILTDAGSTWKVNTFVDYTVNNTTDGSSGIITANTANTVTTGAGLAGGTDNDWDNGDSYIINSCTGAATLANPVPATTLTDGGATWPVNAFVGRKVNNDTDGSSGIITANTATTVTHTVLAGGTDNDWDNGDTYVITVIPNFNPTSDIKDVTLWKDNGDGIFDSSVDSKIDATAGAWTGSGPWTIKLTPKSSDSNRNIDSTANDKVDYFIVIRSEPYRQDEGRKIGYGADFKVSIIPGGVNFSVADPDDGLSRDSYHTKEIKANLEMHSYTGAYIDATSSPIPVIGINACDGPNYTETLEYIKVTFLGPVSGVEFHPSDLAGLVDDDEISGVSLWQDNKASGSIGTFDPQRSRQDTFVPLSEADLHWYNSDDAPGDTPWSSANDHNLDYYMILKPRTAIQLLNDDTYTDSNRGDDYFICIRTGSDIPYNGTRGIDYLDNVQVRIYDGHIQFATQTSTAGSALTTASPLTANVPTFLTNLTTAGVEIPIESSATPVIGLNLVRPDTAPATNVYFTSMVVQILDKSPENFDIKDLKDLSSDPTTSGIALYKDADGNGVFNENNDTGIALAATPALISISLEEFKRVQLVLATPELVPVNDTGADSGDDYFLVIRTSGNLVEGDTFSIRLWGSKVTEIPSRALGFASDNTIVSDTVDGDPGASSTLSATTGGWGLNAYAGWSVVFTDDAGSDGNSAEGKVYYINSNTATTLTSTDANFQAEGVEDGDAFTIIKIDSRSYERLETNTLTGASRRIEVTSPSIVKDPARDNTYIITWTNNLLPSGSTVSLYYDLDNDDSSETTLIQSGFSSTNGTYSYTWDTSLIAEGEHYYIYIKAVTGGTYITSSYSSGNIWVKDDDAPTKAEVSEPSSNVVFDGCSDTFVDGDGTATAGSGTQETISLGTGLTSFKTADLVYWYDADSSNTYSDGDALWLDENYDGRYDSGDSLIIGSPAVNTSGTILTDDYHFVYYDTDKDTVYDSGEDIYYEGETGNHYNYYSGSSSDYQVTIGYDVADPDASASITLLADEDTNPDNGAASTIIGFTLTEAEKSGTYLWDVSGLSAGTSYYVCAEVDDGFNYPLYGYSTGKVGVNNYPYIKVSSPSVDTWTYSSTYTISWTDADPDDNALISLYYDEDTIPDNGNETLITTTTEDSTTDSYEWSLSSVANGTYYIAAKIDDGVNDAYYSYSEGKLTIMDTPEVILTASESYDAVTLNWTDSTPDADDKAIEVYRKDKKNEEWSEYAKITTPSSSDTSYEDTSLELGVIGGYFVQITSPSLGTLYLSNSSTSTINPLEAQRLAFPDEETPDGLEVIPGVNVITVQWNDNSENEDSYEVERKLESAGTDKYANITTTSANSTSYDDTGVTADIGYSYRVRARKYYPETGNYGYSEYTGEAAETSYTFDDNLTIGEAGGGGGCFIATAAFGTEMAEEVILLKKFRDDVLMKTSTGKDLIKLYYSASPSIANFIRNKPMLKAIVRIGLKPLVWWIRCHSRD